MDEGPSQLVRLPLEGKTHSIRSHDFLPYLLRVGPTCVENFNM